MKSLNKSFKDKLLVGFLEPSVSSLGLIIACFVAGFNIERTPLFLIIVIVLLFFTAYAGMKMSNMYEDFASDDEDIKFSTYFPKANFVMSNLPLFIIGMVFSFGLGAIFRGNTSL